MTNHIVAHQVESLRQTIGGWDRSAFLEWSDSQFLADLEQLYADRPQEMRSHLHALQGLLNDESRPVEDRIQFLSAKTSRRFDSPEDGLDWLRGRIEALLAMRPATDRTAQASELPLTLLQTHDLYVQLRALRADPLPSAQDATETAFGRGERFVSELGDSLARFINSTLSNREKADFVVVSVGEFFYSDLEAIEWAAEVARRIQNRPRSVE